MNLKIDQSFLFWWLIWLFILTGVVGIGFMIVYWFAVLIKQVQFDWFMLGWTSIAVLGSFIITKLTEFNWRS